VFLRNRLKYALTYDEVKKIVNQRLVKVDGKVRTDKTYPAGFMGLYFLKGYWCQRADERLGDPSPKVHPGTLVQDRDGRPQQHCSCVCCVSVVHCWEVFLVQADPWNVILCV